MTVTQSRYSNGPTIDACGTPSLVSCQIPFRYAFERSQNTVIVNFGYRLRNNLEDEYYGEWSNVWDRFRIGAYKGYILILGI